MSIRQQRVSSIDKIKEMADNLKGKKISLVLADNTSILGEVQAVEKEGIIVMNGRLRKNHYPFSQIKELYHDQIV